jgi:hypothetical protein
MSDHHLGTLGCSMDWESVCHTSSETLPPVYAIQTNSNNNNNNNSNNDNGTTAAIVTPPRHSVAHRRFLPTLLPISSSDDMHMNIGMNNDMNNNNCSDYNTYCPWEELEDDLAVQLENNPDSLQLFRSVHAVGVCQPAVLKSLAYLSSPSVLQNNLNDCAGIVCSNNNNCNNEYTDTVSCVADYLAQPTNKHKHTTNLACIRLLMTLRSPIEAGWQLQESVLENTVRFVTERSYQWEYIDHSDQVLLWELRAICLCEQERLVADNAEQQQQQLSPLDELTRMQIQRGGEFTAAAISAGARLVEQGLEHSTNMVTSGIGETGGLLIQVLTPQDEPFLDQQTKSGVVTLVYTGAAVRVTDDARTATKGLMLGLCKASTVGLKVAATKFQEEGLGEKLMPHAESRMVMSAVAEVGMATLGAAAIIGESVYNSTSAVIKKTAEVTADVVQHKYGHSAGQVVRDTSDTAGNVLRTIATVTALKGKVLTKAIAKDAGKYHLQEHEKGPSLLDESMLESIDGDEQDTDSVDKDELDESQGSEDFVDIRTIYLSESSSGDFAKHGVLLGDTDGNASDDNKHGVLLGGTNTDGNGNADNKHDDKVAGGSETDETESMTVCGDEAEIRTAETLPRLKLEARPSHSGGGLQIHTRDRGPRNLSGEVVSLTIGALLGSQ